MLAKSYARIHWQNLANFGVLALEFAEESSYEAVRQGETLLLEGLREVLRAGDEVSARIGGREMRFRHRLSPRQIEMVLEGGIIPLRREVPGGAL